MTWMWAQKKEPKRTILFQCAFDWRNDKVFCDFTMCMCFTSVADLFLDRSSSRMRCARGETRTDLLHAHCTTHHPLSRSVTTNRGKNIVNGVKKTSRFYIQNRHFCRETCVRLISSLWLAVRYENICKKKRKLIVKILRFKPKSFPFYSFGKQRKKNVNALILINAFQTVMRLKQ